MEVESVEFSSLPLISKLEVEWSHFPFLFGIKETSERGGSHFQKNFNQFTYYDRIVSCNRSILNHKS